LAEISSSNASQKPAVTRDNILAIAGIETGNHKEMDRRFQALEHYTDLPLPDRVTHLWRYSDPYRFLPMSDLVPRNIGGSPELSETDAEGASVYLVPGCPPSVENWSSAHRLGITMVPLHESEAGIALLGAAVKLDHGLFESLNGALWSTGIFLDIPAQAQLESPIRIVNRAELPTNTFRVVIRVGRGASVNLVELLTGGDRSRHVLGVTEVVVDDGARVEHALIQNWAPGTVGHVTNRARLGRDAVWRSAAVSLGGAAYKADLGASLVGVGAESHLVGVSLSEKQQHMDFHTVHDHLADHTRSKINFKTALTGKSTAVYTGLIRIEAGAFQSEAFQENRNLMLSDKAKSHAIPELEIMTSDVQCSHAATSAPISEEELFYLRSRGISEREAVRMLVRGFFEDALMLIPSGVARDVEISLEERFDRLAGKGGR
jgi:Fe-S cluster assembly protein SufD